jgi:DNA-binding transcriptional regulator YiaG
MCGASSIKRQMEVERFEYGQGKGAVMLESLVPVYICESCEFRYTDHEAESARHDAVCRHLQLMVPTELQKIRDDLGMSREDFSEMSGLGAASISRWELGLTIQNKANDNYIYLLSFKENRDRLQSRHSNRERNGCVIAIASHQRFRGLAKQGNEADPAMLQRAKTFQLRKTH